MKQKPNYFATIPAKILHDKRLSHLQMILYAHISSMTHMEGYCWATNATLGELLGVSPTYISTNIKVLTEFGYLTTKFITKSEQNTERRIYVNFNPVKETKPSKKKPVSTPEPISFTDPIVQSKEQSISQDIDVLSFWNSLLGIYNPEGDKSLHNPSLKKQREKILKHNFTKEERDFILKIFTKYLPQLNIVKPWIGNFFKYHDNMDKVADYFRSIKDVKESQVKPKHQTREDLKKSVTKSLSNY